MRVVTSVKFKNKNSKVVEKFMYYKLEFRNAG